MGIRERIIIALGGSPNGTEPRHVEKLPLSHRPDLAFRDHILIQTAAGESQSLIDSYADFATVYRVHVWVRKAITVIANNFAPLPVAVVGPDGTTIDGHPLAELFANPNDQQSQAEIWETYVVDMMLGGESFFEIVDSLGGTPAEIWARRPDGVLIAPDSSPERLLFPRVGAYKFGDDERIILPENMIHDKFKNPSNPWRGIAPITAIRSSLVIDMFAAAWSKTFLRRGARPDYAVTAPEGLTPTERDDIESQIAAKFGGPDNWHKPMIVSGDGVDVKTLSFPPADIQWLEQRKFARDEIGGVFGVPDEVMGYGRDTYENMDAAHRWLWLLTLVPLVRRRDDRLTTFFRSIRPMLEPGERFQTDLAGVAALQDDIAPLVESARELWSMGVPFNTIDERLGLGIGEIPGGDTGYIPFNLIAADSEPTEPAPMTEPPPTEPAEPEPMDDDEIPDDETMDDNARALARLVARQVAAALGRDPSLIQLPKNGNGSSAIEPPAGVEIVESETHRAIPFGSELHKNIWSQFDRRVERHMKPFQRQLKREFQRQQSETLRNVRNMDGTPTAGELFDARAEAKKFAETFRPQFERAVADFGEHAFDDVRDGVRAVGANGSKQSAVDLDLAFDVTEPEIQRVIDQMAFKFGRDINRTTADKIGDALRPILDQAATEGWSIPEMQRAIYSEISVVFDVRKSEYETERIARTEMNRAANNGTIAGWRQSGVVRGKAWLAALDDRTRGSHIAAHDKYQLYPIPLNAKFEVGSCSGLSPGSTGCAGEDINCRCTMISVLA